jgi:AcrR family transcriptional regulator
MGNATQVAARGRKRSETARKAILRAAYDLIASDGYRTLTFEAVAARSGASRPTIYRWWPNKAALAIDALLSEADHAEPHLEQSDSAIHDIRGAVQRLAKAMSGAYGKAVASVLSSARDEPEILAMYKEKIAGPRRSSALNCLRHGIETGELRAGIDVDIALDALFLPIFVKLVMGLGPLNADWIDRLATFVLMAMVADSTALPRPAPPRRRASSRRAGKNKSRRAAP